LSIGTNSPKPIDFNQLLLPDELPNPGDFGDIPSARELNNYATVFDTSKYNLTYVNLTNSDFWLIILNCDRLYAIDPESPIRTSPWARFKFPAKIGTNTNIDEDNHYNRIDAGTGLHFVILRDADGNEHPIGLVNLFERRDTVLEVSRSNGEFVGKFFQAK